MRRNLIWREYCFYFSLLNANQNAFGQIRIYILAIIIILNIQCTIVQNLIKQISFILFSYISALKILINDNKNRPFFSVCGSLGMEIDIIILCLFNPKRNRRLMTDDHIAINTVFYDRPYIYYLFIYFGFFLYI